MPLFTVTGASGRLGRLAVHALLDRGVPPCDVVAVVRDPARAADLAGLGVQVREGDYALPQTLAAALGGVDRLLLVSSNESGRRVAHHTHVIAAARAAGVSRIVYTSMVAADQTTNPLAGEHQDTERVLRGSGVSTTLLRPGWYTENYTDQLDEVLERGEIVGAAGDGRVSGRRPRRAAVRQPSDRDLDAGRARRGPADRGSTAPLVSRRRRTRRRRARSRGRGGPAPRAERRGRRRSGVR